MPAEVLGPKANRTSGVELAAAFGVGDRVTVAGSPHMPGQVSGAVAIVSGEPVYGIVFDGMGDMGVHKWYVQSELTPGDGEMQMNSARSSRTDRPLERRYTRQAQRVAVETRADGKRTITGYAAVFYDANDPGTEYRLWDDVVERILPGAFDRAVREDDVRGLFNHDDSLMLGRTTSGTMRLSVDKRGLRFEIDPPDTTAAKDLLQLLDRGDVTGSSFAFTPEDTSYRETDGVYIIERRAVKLYDVGPVSFPAYTSTEAAARSVTTEDAERLRKEVQARRVEAASPAPCRTIIFARARAVATLLAE